MAKSEEKSPKVNPLKRVNQQNHDNSGDTKSSKRRRDADQRILDQFWVICDPNCLKRNKSLKIIIDILIKQKQMNDSNDLMYCLERVIRGMASARQFARHGFCVLLTQLLSIFKTEVSLDLVFNLSEKHLGKMDELSNHDSVIGWSLVMASLIQSQRLTEEENKHTFQQTFDVLYNLGINKTYIELVICQLFTQFLELKIKRQIMLKNIVFSRLTEDLKTDKKLKPFFVFVCLSISQHFPNCEEINEFNYIFDNQSFRWLSIMIRESTAYHPSVHPFHRYLITSFMSKSEKDFQDFWNQCIDNVLFAPNNIEKGYLGFELIKISLCFIKTPENVSTVLSPSFVRLFIQALSVKTHPLHSASQQMYEFLCNCIKSIEDSDIQLEFANCFTKQPGSLLFDDISKSKFFSNLLRNLNSESIKEWSLKLKTIFLTTNKLESNDILRIRCIQQISSLSKSLTSSEDIPILWSNIKFLFFHSYFESNKEEKHNIDETLRSPSTPISERLRNSLKDGFRNVFNHLLHLDSKTSKEKLSHEMQILSSMVLFITEIISNESIKCSADSNISELFHTIARKVMKLKKKIKSNDSKDIEIKIFISMYSMAAIQLFEEYEEIQNIIPDLNECAKRAVDGESEEDSGPVWSDVLTDIILSLMTTTSKLTKNVLFSCFKHICCQMSETGVQSLIDAILPANENKLFDGPQDSDEEEEDEDDDDEEDDENEESESGSETDEEKQSAEIDEKFRNDVINALGPAAHNDDDEESVYLSDNEMFQIDETLASVFKTKYSDKKETIEKRNSIIAFRIRCLELIQIFLGHKDISLDQAFAFIDPIVTVAKSLTQSSKQNQLSFKAIELIKQMTKIRDSGDNSLHLNDFQQIMNNLLTVLSKSIHSELQRALTSLISWIITLSKKLLPNNEWYFSDLEIALKSFCEKNNCQTPAPFFKNLISVHNEIGFKLFDQFLEYAFNDDIRPFKRYILVEILIIVSKINFKSNMNFVSQKQLIDIQRKCLKMLSSELSIDNLRAQYVSELLKLFDCIDKYLTDQNSELKISHNEYEELFSRLKSLSKQKRKKLNARDVIKKIFSKHIN